MRNQMPRRRKTAAISRQRDWGDEENDQQTFIAKIGEESNIHGLKEIIFSPNAVLRSFFALTFLGTMGYTIHQLYMVIDEFSAEPTASLVTTYQMKGFPPILYCPVGWANETKLHLLGLGKEELLYLTSILPRNHIKADLSFRRPAEFLLNRTLVEVAQTVTGVLKAQNWTMEDLLKEASYGTTEVVRAFMTGKLTEVLVSKVVTTIGPCYHMKLEQHLNPIDVAESNLLVWITQRDQAFGVEGSANQLYGDHLVVGHHADVADPTGKVVLYKGLSYMVDVVVTRIDRVRTKNFPCRDLSDGGTHQEWIACRISCRNSLCRSNPAINCTNLEPGTNQGPETTFCSQYKMKHYCDNHDSIRNSTGYCWNQCAFPCHFHLDEPTLQPAPLQQASEDGVTKVVYQIGTRNSLWAVHIREYPIYTWQSLVSNIGGVLSLWCGLSFLSITQFCYLYVTK